MVAGSIAPGGCIARQNYFCGAVWISNMLTQEKLMVLLAIVLVTVPASADSMVYIVNGQQFGTIDLGTGAFSQIGPDTFEAVGGLVAGPNGSLLTLAFSGNLDSINPASGVTSIIGPTGLADCSMPSSPCGPTSANTLGTLRGTTYATDLANNLYSVNPLTGAATLIGSTGIPAVPFVPDSTNPDGTFNAFDEALFGAGGNLYATFDAITINPSPFTVTPVISPDLYQINPLTGHATLIGPTALTLGAAIDLNGTVYAFIDSSSEVVALDLANGSTSFVSNFDPAAGVVNGAAPVPEPASIGLAGVGIAALIACRRRRRSA
jgi:hypothetical protein